MFIVSPKTENLGSLNPMRPVTCTDRAGLLDVETGMQVLQAVSLPAASHGFMLASPFVCWPIPLTHGPVCIPILICTGWPL